MVLDTIPLRESDVNLDISGVAGFFGGDVAVSAMATVHVYQGRKWLGWYNSPGSYEVAKRYGQLGRSRWWDGLYPGINVDPAVLFELDGMNGPKYRAVHSGTVMYNTGHLAHLLLQECKNIAPPHIHTLDETQMRVTTPACVTVVDLVDEPCKVLHPRLFRDSTSPLALIPIFVSCATSVACAYYRDWFCFSMIVLGMVSSGLSCYVIGTGVFTFTHPEPAVGAPPGDGVLEGGDQEIVVLKGPEGAVNPITRGRFSLQYASEPEYHNIGLCSMLLTVQFLAQLIIVPQGEIFGQIMFLASLAVSWVYNSYLSSLDKESVQRRILIQQVLQEPRMRKYRLGTRTIMVVFVLLVLSPADEQALRKVLNDMLPNETVVWRAFKDRVLNEVRALSMDEKKNTQPFAFDFATADGYNQSDRKLLLTLYNDARTAYFAYTEYVLVHKNVSRMLLSVLDIECMCMAHKRQTGLHPPLPKTRSRNQRHDACRTQKAGPLHQATLSVWLQRSSAFHTPPRHEISNAECQDISTQTTL